MMMSDYMPPGLPELVGRLKYKPHWKFDLINRYDPDGSGGLTLTILSVTPDSYDVNQTSRVIHPFLVPPASYNERNWLAWIFDCIQKVESHEAGEFFMVDEVRPFAPHHGNGESPYVVWHAGDYVDTRVKFGSTRDEYLTKLARGVDRLRTYVRTRQALLREGEYDHFNRGLERAIDLINDQRE
jgi:hypothetical protein